VPLPLDADHRSEDEGEQSPHGQLEEGSGNRLPCEVDDGHRDRRGRADSPCRFDYVPEGAESKSVTLSTERERHSGIGAGIIPAIAVLRAEEPKPHLGAVDQAVHGGPIVAEA